MTTTMPGTPQGLHLAGSAADPAWVRALRESAATRLAEVGYPTTKDESWRYTPVSEIVKTNWIRATPGPDVPAEDRAIPLDASCRIDVVNGAIAAIQAVDSPKLVIRSIREAWDDSKESAHVKAHLGRVGQAGLDDAFALANAAVMDDGVYIRVAAGVTLERPILIVHHTVPESDAPTSVHPRVLVVVEEGAALTIVDHTLGGSGTGPTLTSAVTEVAVAANGRCDHVLIQDEPAAASHFSTRRASLGANAHFGSHALILSGGLTRNTVEPSLDGEMGHTILTGVYLARDGAHIDNAIRVDHATPNCFSRQFYRGLAGDRGRGVFTGRIVVHLDAQKTDAIQSSSGLLLAPTGHITTRPQLEIYADDVRCTHGSTIGQIDEDAVFYLRARGIPEVEARSLLVRAFIGDIIDRFPDEAIKAWAMERVAAWLDAGGDAERAG